MKKIFGIFLVVSGVLFGVWAGIWWAFIGGIVDVVNEIKAVDTSAVNIAIGIAKVFFAVPIGYAAAAVAVLPGWAILVTGNGSVSVRGWPNR